MFQLYKVSDASGEMETVLVCGKAPFKQNMLDSGDVFIVNNTGARQILVWKGTCGELAAGSLGNNLVLKFKF